MTRSLDSAKEDLDEAYGPIARTIDLIHQAVGGLPFLALLPGEAAGLGHYLRGDPITTVMLALQALEDAPDHLPGATRLRRRLNGKLERAVLWLEFIGVLNVYFGRVRDSYVKELATAVKLVLEMRRQHDEGLNVQMDLADEDEPRLVGPSRSGIIDLTSMIPLLRHLALERTRVQRRPKATKAAPAAADGTEVPVKKNKRHSADARAAAKLMIKRFFKADHRRWLGEQRGDQGGT